MAVLELTRDGQVATLWLANPDKRNAMGEAFFAELPARIAEVADDDGLRVLRIAARGPAFSVGLDLAGGMGERFSAHLGGGLAAQRHRLYRDIQELQRGFVALRQLAKPVIAAVHGYCLGGGLDLIAACDLRLASRDAVVSLRETRVAMVADLGSLQRLPAIIGQGHTRDLAFTGRDVEAEEARAMGLFNAVHDDVDALQAASLELAQRIAANAPLAVQGAKLMLNQLQRSTEEPGLDYVALYNAAHLASEDLLEALAAFAQKRAPRFVGR